MQPAACIKINDKTTVRENIFHHERKLLMGWLKIPIRNAFVRRKIQLVTVQNEKKI